MIYTQLFDKYGSGKTVRAGVIGTGQYATAVVTQSRVIPRLDVPITADVNVDAARRAYLLAGYAEDEITVCEGRTTALAAVERGEQVVVPDALLLMELPVDVIVEATGVPEAGANHVQEAIRHGKHVAIVSKETDATVGPILKYLADGAGVVYTAVDGDQPGLLMGLVAWARELGLEVLCAGKARDMEYIFDAEGGTVTDGSVTMTLDPSAARALAPISPGQAARVVHERRAVLGDLNRIGVFDVAEMVIAANATGLLPDVEELHCPALRTVEIPGALCPAESGGILRRPGVIDAVTCLRHPYEAGLGGGVFVVVACENEYSRRVLVEKGLIPNSRGSTALIYRPYHLCGVETAISILAAGLLGVPTGATEYLPRVDMVARTTVDLKKGETLGEGHGAGLEALMRPAQPVRVGSPLPFYMAAGNTLKVNVPAGTVITTEMIVPPKGSVLWTLRAQQDECFSTQLLRE